MRPRTRRQREIFDYIAEFVENNGHDPSYNQIAKHFRLRSKSAVAKHIEALEEQGLLNRIRENGHFRLDLGLTTSETEELCKVEWIRLPKDSPNPTLNHDVFVPRFMIGIVQPHVLRAFVVPNNAMLGANIARGDIAIIEKKSFARDGVCVCAKIPGDEVVLGGYSRNGGKVELLPKNDNYDTYSFSANEVAVLGVFRGLIRPFS